MAFNFLRSTFGIHISRRKLNDDRGTLNQVSCVGAYVYLKGLPLGGRDSLFLLTCARFAVTPSARHDRFQATLREPLELALMIARFNLTGFFRPTFCILVVAPLIESTTALAPLTRNTCSASPQDRCPRKLSSAKV